ncbi:UNVERIFIED_CONTAM: hypothetical protein FKN15_029737 [Acipenser sinensis]
MRVPSADRFISHCGLTMQPPKSHSVGGQRSSRAAYRQARSPPTRLQGSLVRAQILETRLILTLWKAHRLPFPAAPTGTSIGEKPGR